MKIKKIPKLIGATESMVIEWKPSLSQINEIIESITAFSNTDGSRVFIGVSKDGKIIGVSIGKDTIENLTNRIAQHTEPKIHPHVTVTKIDNKEIIIIDIKESHDKLALANGKPYIRVGKSTRQMSKDDYEHRILEKHKDKLQFDAQVCRGAKLKDIDSGKVKWFLKKAHEERRLIIPEKVSTKEALEFLKVLHDGKPNNTAILLFGKDPQKFFVQAKIRAGRIKGTEGHDKWEYPLRVLEEALNNALAHRDYFSNADIQLAVYDDRIENWNPGELSKQLTPEQLKVKHRSIPRNPFLADKLYLIKYIERWGRGTNRIVDEMRQDNLPDPIFANNSGGFEISLIGPGKRFVKAIEDVKLHKLDLNDRQRKAVESLIKNGEISRKEYAKITEVSLRQANKDLEDLLKKKVIVQVGMGRSTKYLVHD